ncbi:MAG: hypothetical protein NZM38_02350 [Cytophagales bacterium]|nr:hypothetical protein [Cytophagales bacterium]MDW8383594.1 hypothetical protein [Flammeovirgaceae bacterium]
MKKIIFLLSLFSQSVWGQIGLLFPEIEGITLKEKKMSIPSSTKGKVTLVGIAYSKKSDELLKEWHNPMYETFINPPKSVLVPTDEYDVHMYFIGMLRGLADVVSDKIIKDMKVKIDSKLHSNVLVYEGSIKEYKELLKLGEKELPYFFVLDKNGKIVYTTSGAYSDAKMDDIVEVVEKFLE